MRSRGFIFLLIALWLFTRLLKATNRQTATTTLNKNPFFNTLYEKLKDLGFSETMSAYIASQSAFETGNFTSKLFKRNNNLFGMTDASGRENKQLRVDSDGFGVYASPYTAILDFKDYYNFKKYWYSYGSLESYIGALKQNKYFTAPEDEYLNGVKFYYNLYFGEGV